MSCNNPRRPERVTCQDCKKPVLVKRVGPVPTRCRDCAPEHYQREWKAARAHERQHGERPLCGNTGAFALGPSRPEGWTAEERLEWARRRAVELYLEGDLSSYEIAERLGISPNTVMSALTKAGVPKRPPERDKLPFGSPSE